MDSAIPYSTSRHPEHDVSWLVVCGGHGGVLCVACLVEQLEDKSRPLIQRRVVLSMLVGLLRDWGELTAKFGSNLLLSRHVLDVVTDQFFGNCQYIEDAVEVCQLVLESVQSEDLVWYIVDKFHFQLQSSSDLIGTTPYLLLLGQLLIVSPAYGFHLLDKHERLLLLMVRLVSDLDNESCQCSVVYILIQLFDDTLQSDMSPSVRSSVYAALVSLLSNAETLDLRVNLLALLKKMLKQMTKECVRCLISLNCNNKSLVMGLKKMFITKQEVLQTASAQCVHGLIARSGDVKVVTEILDSDLAEFLFESLHTHNCPQLNSVYECLQILATYEQFFSRCHAVYGVDSILGSLGVVLDMKNFCLAEKGFSLLANILDRQPSSMPLFVNVRSVKLCVQLIQQGLSHAHCSVFNTALFAACSLIRQQYVPWPASSDVIQEIVQAASTHLKAQNMSQDGHRHTDRRTSLTAFVQFITESCRLCDKTKSSEDESDSETLSILLSAAETHLLPTMLTVFDESGAVCDMKMCVDCVNVLMSVKLDQKSDKISLPLVNSGVLVKAQVIKSSIDDLQLCEMMNTFLCNLYQFLLTSALPLLSILPPWLVSGVDKLKLESVEVSCLLRAVSGEVDVAWTTLTMLYFSYLHDCSCVEVCELSSLLQCFLSQNRDMNQLPPLVIRSLAFLAACTAGADHDEEENSADVHNLVDMLESCPTDVWFTHHPVLVSWIFSRDDLTRHLGHTLMEHWLPLMDLCSVQQRLTAGPWTPNTTDPSTQEEPSDPDVALLEDLFDCPAFVCTLLSMLIAPEDIASLAMVVTEHLMTKLQSLFPAVGPKVDEMLDTCNDLFHQLFLQDSDPQDYQVSYLLKVMTQLLSNQNRSSRAFNVKVVYHVVKYVGSHPADSPTTPVCLLYLLQYTEDTAVADCLCIGSILAQNKEFMTVLDQCLTSDEASDQAMQLVAWLASLESPGFQVPHQVNISPSFLLKAVTSRSKIQCGSLSLLSASLSVPEGSRTSAVVFSRDCLLGDTPLYTVRDVRTIYFHLQQLVCHDSPGVFRCGLKCIHQLYNYCDRVHQSLALYLSSHPWNRLWFQTLLHTACQGETIQSDTLAVIHMLSNFPPGRQLLAESGELFLNTVLKSSLQSSQREVISHIVTKCSIELEKTVKPDVLQRVKTCLQQMED